MNRIVPVVVNLGLHLYPGIIIDRIDLRKFSEFSTKFLTKKYFVHFRRKARVSSKFVCITFAQYCTLIFFIYDLFY